MKPNGETSPTPFVVDLVEGVQKGAENDEMTENNILDDDQSEEIYNKVVEQMTLEEADTDQLTPGSYGYVAAKRKKGFIYLCHTS